ncbi:unknown [Bacteroides sp. CAG:875]|nr:unknown [Bacteroides sp. CAG:875]
MCQLQGCSMEQISYYQQFSHLEHRVSGRMSHRIHGHYIFRERIPENKEMQTVLVSLHGFLYLCFLVGRHLHPRIVFQLGSIHFRTRKNHTVVFHHATDVISMKMGYEQVVDIFRMDVQSFQTLEQPAIGRPHSGIKKHAHAILFNQEGADRSRYPIL